MALFWPTRRRKKFASPNFVSATAFKFQIPLAIEIMTYKDKKIVCLYINAQIRKQKLSKTLIDSQVMIKFISQKVVHDLDLQVYYINRK